MSVVTAFIVGALVAGIVYGLKKLVFKNKIPPKIEKYRMVITGLIAIISVVIAMVFFDMEDQLQSNTLLIGFICWTIYSALKNEIQGDGSQK